MPSNETLGAIAAAHVVVNRVASDACHALRRLRALPVALCILTALAGCGGGGDPSAEEPPPSVAPAPVTPAPAGTIGPAGGTARSADGAEVSVPAGALADPTTVQVQASSAGAPGIPPGVAALGKVFAFTPHGTTFAVPVQVTLPFDAHQVPAGVTPVLYKTHAATGGWVPVPGAVVDGAVMRAEVSGFSHFVVAPPAASLTGLQRTWRFEAIASGGTFELLPSGEAAWWEFQDDRIVSGRRSAGASGGSRYAHGWVWGNATGSQYEVEAISPAIVDGDGDSPHGLWTQLQQHQFFFKQDESAALKFVISNAALEGIDRDPRALQCVSIILCNDLHAEVQMKVLARDLDTGKTFFARHGRAWLFGSHQGWWGRARSSSAVPLWKDAHFLLDDDVEHNGTHGVAIFRMKDDLVVHVPLADVPVNHRFALSVYVHALTLDHRQTETSAIARLRDPQSLGGSVQVEHTGLVPVGGDPSQLAEEPEPTAPECPGAPDPQAGMLEFDAPAFVAAERPASAAEVLVRRIGGMRGTVSARVRTRDGTALAGSDYAARSVDVVFADGEDGTRLVELPILNDAVVESDETVELVLEDVRGCALAGAQTAAVLTIVDDDAAAAPPPAYTVGGTVTGLAGTGLVLEDRARGTELAVTANGSFQFGASYPAGGAYDVRVAVPPTNPVQLCTVMRSSGTVASANVTDIAVDCVTPPPASGLDLSFGAGTGKVTAWPAGIATAIALQADGRIVAAIGNSVARYLADGSLDTTFGSNGSVGSALGSTNHGATILDLAVQADGRIVVAGTARGTSLSTLAYDFAAARLNADGSRDADFNGGNPLQVDWIAAPDRATRVLLQPDGKIVLAGTATTVYTPTNDDSGMALVRLNADGSLDAGFGAGGRAVAEFGQLDFGYAAALQPDGKIVVAGRVSANRADTSHFGVARFNADGTLDAGFGSGGKVYLDELGEAVDLVLQPDGRLVLALVHADAGNLSFGVLRLNTDGSRDAGFGSNGFAFGRSGTGRDNPTALALQADGRIVVVGSSLNTATSFDFVVGRFLASGALDTAFGNSGFYSLDLFNGRDGAYDVLVQPDGKVLASGFAGSGLSSLPLLVRIHP